MILEAVRLLAAWLGNGTYGIAAKLAALPKDGSDSTPSGTLSITEETTGAAASVDQYPAAWSCVVAAQPVESLDGQAATYTHDADVPLLLRLCRTDSNAAAAARDLYYTLRATVQSIEALFNDANTGAVAARTRNSVQAYAIVALGQARTRDEPQDNVVTGALAVTLRCRDLVA